LEALSLFENQLTEKRPAAIALLQPGLSHREITKQLKRVGIENDQVTALYSWRNGISASNFQSQTIDELEIFPTKIMLSLEEAINAYEICVNRKKEWDEHFFPLFTDGGGDYILFNFDKSSPDHGQLYFYSPSLLLSEKPVSIYDSVERMIYTFAKSLEAGVYIQIPGEDPDIDFEVIYAIGKKINPKSEYYQRTERTW
jgi:hypothetical protein